MMRILRRMGIVAPDCTFGMAFAANLAIMQPSLDRQ